uniref:Uncharacterized protein n=1 Tax=Romanomermis culicivorax TaxID=13658 RepID=A0A915IXE5_ROMCU
MSNIGDVGGCKVSASHCINDDGLIVWSSHGMYKAADGAWLSRIMATMLLTAAIASPCSTAEFTYVNDLLAQHSQTLDDIYKCLTPFTTLCGSA